MTVIQFDDGLTASINRGQWACDNSQLARMLQTMSDDIDGHPSIPDLDFHKANEMCRVFDATVTQKEPPAEPGDPREVN